MLDPVSVRPPIESIFRISDLPRIAVGMIDFVVLFDIRYLLLLSNVAKLALLTTYIKWLLDVSFVIGVVLLFPDWAGWLKGLPSADKNRFPKGSLLDIIFKFTLPYAFVPNPIIPKSSKVLIPS